MFKYLVPKRGVQFDKTEWHKIRNRGQGAVSGLGPIIQLAKGPLFPFENKHMFGSIGCNDPRDLEKRKRISIFCVRTCDRVSCWTSFHLRFLPDVCLVSSAIVVGFLLPRFPSFVI